MPATGRFSRVEALDFVTICFWRRASTGIPVGAVFHLCGLQFDTWPTPQITRLTSVQSICGVLVSRSGIDTVMVTATILHRKHKLPI